MNDILRKKMMAMMQLCAQPGGAEIVLHQLADVADGLGELVGGDHLRIERQHDQRQRAVFRQQLAADDLVGFHRLDELVVVGAFGQVGREQRGRQFPRRRRLPRRKQRDQAACAVDELQVGDEVAQFLQIVAREQVLAFDHGQDVEFLCREFLRHVFVLVEFLAVGAEQLAERVVDLDAVDAERGADEQNHEDDAGQDRRLHREQAEPRNPERDAFGRRLLDHLDMDFIVASFFEHALSSSHIGSGSIA
jgi:hypothetical protein